MFNELKLEDVTTVLSQLPKLHQNLDKLNLEDLNVRVGMIILLQRIQGRIKDAPAVSAPTLAHLVQEMVDEVVNEVMLTDPEARVARCRDCTEGCDHHGDAAAWAYEHSKQTGHLVTIYHINNVQIRKE